MSAIKMKRSVCLLVPVCCLPLLAACRAVVAAAAAAAADNCTAACQCLSLAAVALLLTLPPLLRRCWLALAVATVRGFGGACCVAFPRGILVV